MAQAIIEGLCYSFRQTFEILIKEQSDMVTLIGGGSKSEVWCQALANILGKKIRVPQNSEYLPALGAASSAFVHLGWVESYEAFVDSVLLSEGDRNYYPDPNVREVYDSLYEKFVNLYPSIKNLYGR